MYRLEDFYAQQKSHYPYILVWSPFVGISVCQRTVRGLVFLFLLEHLEAVGTRALKWLGRVDRSRLSPGEAGG